MASEEPLLLGAEPVPVTTAQFLRGRVVWGHGFARDLLMYLRNHHNLLSLCLAHPRFPFGKCVRWAVFVSVLCAAFFFSAFIALKLGCNQCTGATCSECLADDLTLQRGFRGNETITASTDNPFLLAFTRWYARGPCGWCGNETNFRGGCYTVFDIAYLKGIVDYPPNTCSLAYAQSNFTLHCAHARPAPPPEVLPLPPGDAAPFPHYCALHVRKASWFCSFVAAVLVFFYERMLFSCAYCHCAYNRRTKERRHALAFCCLKGFGCGAIVMAVLLGLPSLFAGVLFIAAAGNDYVLGIESFFVSKVGSWLVGLVLSSAIFTLKWQCEMHCRPLAGPDEQHQIPLLPRSYLEGDADVDDAFEQPYGTSIEFDERRGSVFEQYYGAASPK